MKSNVPTSHSNPPVATDVRNFNEAELIDLLEVAERKHGYIPREISEEINRLVEMRVEKPFPMMICYELDDDQDGATRVAIHTTGTPGGFFGLAAPLMTRQVRGSITADLRRLRDRLETLT